MLSRAIRVSSRGMATATASKVIKPPIQLFGLDGTYANALYSASVKDSSVDKTNSELIRLTSLLKSDKKVAEILDNPTLSAEAREIVAKTISQNLSLDKTTSTFLSVLAENNRLANVSDIAAQFAQLDAAHNGIIEATVKSAKPLDPKIIKKLHASISKLKLVGPNKTLKINNVVEPDILGGLIVEVGDKTADLSIFSKVARLDQAISSGL